MFFFLNKRYGINKLKQNATRKSCATGCPLMAAKSRFLSKRNQMWCTSHRNIHIQTHMGSRWKCRDRQEQLSLVFAGTSNRPIGGRTASRRVHDTKTKQFEPWVPAKPVFPASQPKALCSIHDRPNDQARRVSSVNRIAWWWWRGCGDDVLFLLLLLLQSSAFLQ